MRARAAQLPGFGSGRRRPDTAGAARTQPHGRWQNRSEDVVGQRRTPPDNAGQLVRRTRQATDVGAMRSIRANTTVSAAYLSKPRSPLWWVIL